MRCGAGGGIVVTCGNQSKPPGHRTVAVAGVKALIHAQSDCQFNCANQDCSGQIQRVWAVEADCTVGLNGPHTLNLACSVLVCAVELTVGLRVYGGL